MFTRPVSIIRLLEPFGTIFQAKTWEKAQLLLVGAILSPGKRTVTSALRVMGLSRDGNFARYHHVLNRARWSSLQLSRTLLFLLPRHLDSGIGPLVFGIDETIERRRGKRISAKGIYPTFPIWLKSFLSNSSMVFQPLSIYGPFLRVPSYNNSMICHFAVRCRRHHGGT